MAKHYDKVFTNPYPNGWKNLPSIETPILAQALQQHTNAIVAIEEFLNRYGIPTNISDLYNDGIIPTKVSQLQNDSGYVKNSDIPKKVSQLTNDNGYISLSQVPNYLSYFQNDVNYVTETTKSLLYYYLKSELYNKQEINQLLSNLDKGIMIEIVDQLPTTNIKENTIYFVPKVSDTSRLVEMTNTINLDANVVNNNYNLILPIATNGEEEVGDPFNG